MEQSDHFNQVIKGNKYKNDSLIAVVLLGGIQKWQ